MSVTKDQARSLANKILSFSKAEECEVTLDLSSESFTRFAAGDVTTCGAFTDASVTIASRSKGKTGTVRLNDTDPAALKRAVERSEEAMALAPVDPEWVEGLGPQEYSTVPAFHADTAKAGSEERREAVKTALDAARARKMNSSGFFETETHSTAIANKRGLFGFHPWTQASFSTTMRTADGTGSGWAGLASPRISDIRAGELVTTAVRKSETSARPRDLEPGRYTVILEPQAVADLLQSLGFSLSARAADEGRSFFSKPGGATLLGEKVFAESVTIRSDPFDARLSGRPWAGGGGGTIWGLPSRRTAWIEKGVVKTLSRDRYWASKTNKEAVPYSSALVMEGGKGTVDDLVAGAVRALLVTRFWYIRTVNPQTIQQTGLTRDGVWLVENGKVVGPVNNFRFNESPADLLKNVEALSAPVSTGQMVVPAIRAHDFLFSSKSDAV